MFSVSLIGKQNVGKSTLFNRIIMHKKAIVSDFPGTTRDRIFGVAKWLSKEYFVIDTGGLSNNNFSFKENIEEQVNVAINESDLILFVVSMKEGITNDDYYVAKKLKQYKNKKIILVVNKSENMKDTKQFYSLGFGEPFFISAEHGIGVGDLLNKINEFNNQENKNEKKYSFCIIGKTNTGKSTLLNLLAGKNRVIASPVENTTRDSIDVDIKYDGEEYTIIDTAGIKRKSKIIDEIEGYAILRSENAIRRSDLIILMFDGKEGITELDKSIANLAYEANIPTIICINKTDLFTDRNITDYKVIIAKQLQFLSWAPIIFISAKNKKNIDLIFKNIKLIREQAKMKISKNALIKVLCEAEFNNSAPKHKGNRINIEDAEQVEGKIPTFVLYSNDPKYLHFTYARYIENKLRDSFAIKFVPITIYYKKNEKRRVKKNKNS